MRQLPGIARVAAMAALVVLLLYAVVAIAIDYSIFRSLVADADSRVSVRLGALERDPRAIRAPSGDENQPVYWWLYGLDGRVAVSMPGAPSVPSGLRPSTPTWLDVAGHHFRVQGVRALDISSGQPVGWLMVGSPVDDVYAAVFRLGAVEAGVAIPVVLLTFLGALLIGRRAVAPVEDARRRQLAFTADASHELRTPLTVIEAEASLALQKDRDADSYRNSIERIAAEGARLRRIVEDLLWLARFESEPDRPAPVMVDVGEVATTSVSRFRHVADRGGVQLTGRVTASVAPLITAPEDWIDRLAGVLIDNACRYTPPGGTVEVAVVTGDGRVRLAVDDSGPGIPADEQAQIFDRFHRANSKPGGAGLGLAIGNAIVTATGGHWEVGASPAGGTRMAVSWPLLKAPRELEPAEDAAAAAPEARQPG